MKVVGINGSARKDGNTAILIKRVMTIKFSQVPLFVTEHMYYNDNSTYERGPEPCHNKWVLASLTF
ncbi:MAG: hypothetical protein PHE51_12415, partial [Eubacteriales bacterium]|nr:hypothetical protein [Eubacteriales bacterium]